MTIYFTKESLGEYKKTVTGLENKLRKIQATSQEVVESGDCWHDNAGYDLLIEDLRVQNRRLNDAHKLLNEAKIIEYPSSVDETVVIGTRATISLDGVRREYEIVAYGDEDGKTRILYSSPIAAALIGHKIDGDFEANINGKLREIEILKIEPLKKNNRQT